MTSRLIPKSTFDVIEELAHRAMPEPRSKYRSEFLRDRDRILYSLEFRRLDGKTQVVLPFANDHIRNRLTHTLQVAQISDVIAKYFGLNTDLTQAIALGHDLGHTPFGHVGERTLNFIMNNCESYFIDRTMLPASERGFKHNLQGIRVCCDLERIYPTIKGLNLTNFTLWGIKNHSSTKWRECPYYSDEKCHYKLIPRLCSKKGALETSFYDRYKGYTSLEGVDKEAWYKH